MKRTVYIAGKISGMEVEAAKLFNSAQAKLEAQGFNVINPMKLNHDHDKEWISYMRVCFPAMAQCDCIFFLPNWTESTGAVNEALHAMQLQLEVLNLPGEDLQDAYSLVRQNFIDTYLVYSS